MFVCVAMTLGFLAITEPIFADNAHPKPTPRQCAVCQRERMDHRRRERTLIIDCEDVCQFLARHPGSCAGPCPCHVTGVQNL